MVRVSHLTLGIVLGYVVTDECAETSFVYYTTAACIVIETHTRQISTLIKVIFIQNIFFNIRFPSTYIYIIHTCNTIRILRTGSGKRNQEKILYYRKSSKNVLKTYKSWDFGVNFKFGTIVQTINYIFLKRGLFLSFAKCKIMWFHHFFKYIYYDADILHSCSLHGSLQMIDHIKI